MAQRSLVPTLGIGNFRSYPGRQVGRQRQQIKSPLNTIQRDTAYTSSCAYVSQPDRRETHRLAVSMHDLRVYLKINKKTTRVCRHQENTDVNCRPTSLLDHFVKQQVLAICLVIERCAFTHEGQDKL